MRILLLSNMYPSPQHPSSGIFVRNQVERLERVHGVCASLVVSPGRALGWLAKLVKYSRLHALAWRHVVGRHHLIHLHYASPAHFCSAWPALLRLHLPLVVTVHGGDIHSLPPRGIRRVWVRAMLRRAAAVIAVSRDLSHALSDGLGVRQERIEVIDVGCDLRRFSPAPPQALPEIRARFGFSGDRVVLLFVGHLGQGKGLDILLRALELLRDRKRLALVVAGSGPLARPLAAAFAARVPEMDVRWLGEIRHSRLPDLYRAADIFVLPSRSEGRPAAILESMACATPVVASRVGGIPEIIRHGSNGLLFDTERADLLASALRELIAEPRLRARIAAQALEDVASHSLARQAARVYAVYRGLLDPDSRRSARHPGSAPGG
jgi:glycosyltransferase involved in cell wall biosynthesis